VNAPFVGLLAPRLTVLNYDRRGRGDSGDTAPYAVDREYEDLEAVIDAAGGSASLFGNSGGGILALEAAARGLAVTRIAVWEPPYIIDGSRPPVPADYRRQLGDLPAAGATWSSCPDPGGGDPGHLRRLHPPVAVLGVAGGGGARLVYDADIVGDFSLPAARLATVKAPPGSSGARPRG
jgi:pimeloyl-ACP methyl ester carboxylesterase